MNKNFEVVSLILKDPKLIPVWLDEDLITIEDLEAGLDYIKDQNILSGERLIKKAEYLEGCCKIYSRLKLISNSGASSEEIIEFMEKAQEELPFDYRG